MQTGYQRVGFGEHAFCIAPKLGHLMHFLNQRIEIHAKRFSHCRPLAAPAPMLYRSRGNHRQLWLSATANIDRFAPAAPSPYAWQRCRHRQMRRVSRPADSADPLRYRAALG